MLHPARSQHDADMYAMAERYRAATSGGGLATGTAVPPPPPTDESWRHPDEQIRVVPPPEDDLIRAGVELEPPDVESVPLFDAVDPDEDPFAVDTDAPSPAPRRRGRPRKDATSG